MGVVPALTTVIGIISILAISRLRRGPLLSPISVALLMLVSIFGVRPLLMASRGEYGFYGGDSEVGFQIAANVGFFALTALLAGYSLAATRDARIGSTRQRPLNAQASKLAEVRPEVGVSLALVIALFVVLMWFAIMAWVGGGTAFISLLFAGRSEEVSTRLENVPSIVPALPVVAALIAANTRLLQTRLAPFTSGQNALYWIVIAAAVIPPAALGTRRFLIPSLVAGALGVAAASWFKRVSARMLIAIVVGFLLLAILPFVRSAGSRTGSADLLGAMFEFFTTEGVGGVLDSFFLSYDTEMFNYVAYVAPALGNQIPYGQGRMLLGDLLLAPVPASIAPATTYANQVLTALFGGGCSEVYCPVPSLPGALYFDGGFILVILGMFVTGWAMNRFEPAFLRASGWKLSALLVLAAFTIQIMRGNPASQLWIAIQVFLLVVIAMRLARYGARRGLKGAGHGEEAVVGQRAASAPRNRAVSGFTRNELL